MLSPSRLARELQISGCGTIIEDHAANLADLFKPKFKQVRYVMPGKNANKKLRVAKTIIVLSPKMKYSDADRTLKSCLPCGTDW